MGLRTHLVATMFLGSLTLLTRQGIAAPQAQILRIDPRAAQNDGSPILNTVIEVAEAKRTSEVVQECATLRGDAQLACMSNKLAQTGALFTSYDFPEKTSALFTVAVDGEDKPAELLTKHKWGESQNVLGVGTAWLVLVDGTVGARLGDAKAVAAAFVNALGPQDIVNFMVFGDRQVVSDTKWLAATQKADVITKVNATPALRSEGRARPLFTILRSAITDSFKELGNVGQQVPVPLHQAVVVLSSGSAGADPLSTGAGASQLNQYLTKGRFPEDNTALPKTPLPVISILLPTPGLTEELTKGSQEFMVNLANPEIGGYFNLVRGNGQAAGPAIAAAVRDRFNKMFMVRWRVSCIAPTVTQSFRLNFMNVNPPIVGDNSFKDVPIGIDPTSWPLDVNVAYTTEMAKRDPVHPGGKVTIYGSFCWGGNKERAQIYFLPSGTQAPASVSLRDAESAKRTQQQLVAMGMDGKATKATDGSVEFEVPDKDKLLWGSGDQAVARVVVYDSVAKRMSGVTANTVLSLKASSKPFPWLWIGAGFALVGLGLIAAVAMRSGGKKPRRGGGHMSPPAPLQPGPGANYPYGSAGGAGGYNPAAQPPPQAYPSPAGAAPMAGPAMGGGYPAPAAAPSRATLSGSAGLHVIPAGGEVRIGRDPSQCQLVLNEPRVSSVHVTAKLEGGQLWIRDEQSNNGTAINGNRMAPGAWTPVAPGSTLQIGPLEFVVGLE